MMSRQKEDSRFEKRRRVEKERFEKFEGLNFQERFDYRLLRVKEKVRERISNAILFEFLSSRILYIFAQLLLFFATVIINFAEVFHCFEWNLY